MPTFRVRQEVTYYLETTVEAPSKEALWAYLGKYDLEEQFEDHMEPEEGPWQKGDPEVDGVSDKAPQWRLEGDKLVPIKKRVV